MKLEKQVCSMELSIKLKELGLRVESLWYWFIDDIRDNSVWCLDTNMNINDDGIYNAFTVAELGEIIKDEAVSLWNGEMWSCITNQEDEDIWFNEKTEADARAKMLCFLLESNLIKI